MGFLFFGLVEVSELNGNGKNGYTYIRTYYTYTSRRITATRTKATATTTYYYILLLTTTKKATTITTTITTTTTQHTHQPTDSTPQEDKKKQEESSQRKGLSYPRSLIPIPASAFCIIPHQSPRERELTSYWYLMITMNLTVFLSPPPLIVIYGTSFLPVFLCPFSLSVHGYLLCMPIFPRAT